MSQLQTPRRDTSEEDLRIERTIVSVLLASRPTPWSIDELALELGGERTTTLDGIDRLRRAGVIHRCGDFAFVTRATAVLDEMRC